MRLVADGAEGEKEASGGEQEQQGPSKPDREPDTSQQRDRQQPRPSAQQDDDSAAAHASHRQPSIQFPRRRLPDGTRISDLPVNEQLRWGLASDKTCCARSHLTLCTWHLHNMCFSKVAVCHI